MHFDLVYTECQNASTDPAPVELSFVTATFSVVLLLVTVPTNLLVCLAILIDPNKELKTQFNCFTFNLALADLLVGCVTESISVFVHVEEGMDTERGSALEPAANKVLNIQYFISVMASMLSISALALERYLAVIWPFLYRQYFSVKLAVVMSVVIWTIAICFGLINIFVEYILASFIFVNTAVLFTVAVVGFVCFRICCTLRRTSNDWAAIESQRSQRPGQNGVQKRLTATFALIIGALVCCYVPACSMIYFMNLCQNCDCELIQWLRDAAFWLVLLNSAINPFVYAIRSSSFRNAIRQILRCRCRHDKRQGYSHRQTLNPKFANIQNQNEEEREQASQTSGYGSLSVN